jgi:hypothetical protein
VPRNVSVPIEPEVKTNALLPVLYESKKLHETDVSEYHTDCWTTDLPNLPLNVLSFIEIPDPAKKIDDFPDIG